MVYCKTGTQLAEWGLLREIMLSICSNGFYVMWLIRWVGTGPGATWRIDCPGRKQGRIERCSRSHQSSRGCKPIECHTDPGRTSLHRDRKLPWWEASPSQLGREGILWACIKLKKETVSHMKYFVFIYCVVHSNRPIEQAASSNYRSNVLSLARKGKREKEKELFNMKWRASSLFAWKRWLFTPLFPSIALQLPLIILECTQFSQRAQAKSTVSLSLVPSSLSLSLSLASCPAQGNFYSLSLSLSFCTCIYCVSQNKVTFMGNKKRQRKKDAKNNENLNLMHTSSDQVTGLNEFRKMYRKTGECKLSYLKTLVRVACCAKMRCIN